MNTTEKFVELNKILTEIQDLKSAQNVLIWDLNTHMPKQGAAMRGRHIATLGKLAHEKFTSSEVGDLLSALDGYEKSFSKDSYETCLLRHVRSDYEKSSKLKPEFVGKMLEHQAACYDKWIEARRDNDFKAIVPYLEKTLELSQQYANHFKYDHIADPLIAESDEGFTTKTIKEIFAKLKAELVPFVKSVVSHEDAETNSLNQIFPIDAQEQINKEIAEMIGYDFNRGRLDKTHHPFMITLCHDDVRITTRYRQNEIAESIFSTIHETGHALYELGIDPALDGTPLGQGASSAVHESQSRLWENLVGRSFEFWEFYYPKLKAKFPNQLAHIELEQFYKHINHVSTSLIRTDADELTYNLHVMIRFQLECEMLEGKLKVKDLSEAWNALYKSDLNVTVPNDANGCLQDVHWFSSFIGGQFQGYTLGNIMSAQFFAAAQKDLPDIKSLIKNGNFTPLRSWLNKNLHVHGKKYLGHEVLKMATHSDLDIAPYISYLKGKFSKIK